jgi:uncharacterized iron-regulated protein
MVVLAAALGSTGCSLSTPMAAITGPQIWDVQAARFVDEDELVSRLIAARYRLLGEVHDNPEHHAIRARLIRRIAAGGARPAVVFEQFNLDRAEPLASAQRATSPGARPDAEGVATAGGLDRTGWQWPLHKPVIEAALAAGLQIHAGNASRADVMRAARTPGDPSPDTHWGRHFAAAPWTDEQESALRNDIVEGHCGKLPEQAIAAVARAQRIRDATLAQALADAAAANPRAGAILIAGNGHVRRDLGVPAYLQAPAPEAGSTLLSVGFVESTIADRQSPGVPREVIRGRPPYDFVWVTDAVARGDPCARMP